MGAREVEEGEGEAIDIPGVEVVDSDHLGAEVFQFAFGEQFDGERCKFDGDA
jgi:hypothetical protein